MKFKRFRVAKNDQVNRHNLHYCNNIYRHLIHTIILNGIAKKDIFELKQLRNLLASITLCKKSSEKAKP